MQWFSQIRSQIPNLFTLGNLCTGMLGIIYLFETKNVEGILFFVLIGALFDFFDGFVARWLKVASPVGKELDSLADVVSFGLFPALLVYTLLGNSFEANWVPWLSLLLAAMSAMRLAIFNVDDEQSEVFKGLPTPANALFFAGLPLLHLSYPLGNFWPWILVFFTMANSLLLVSRVELMALKFKSFQWNENKWKYSLLLLGAGLLLTFKWAGIPLVIILYVILSLIKNVKG